MNSSLKTVGLLAVVAGIVGGLTYLLHYTSSPATGGGGVVGPVGSASQLTIPVKTVEWGEAAEFEVNAEGHYDFPYHNAETVPLSVGLVDSNCVCARVELCQLSPEDTRRFLTWSAVTHVLTAAAWKPVVGQNPVALLGHLWDVAALERLNKASLRWERLEKGGSPVVVSPGVAGLIRVIWKGKQQDAIRLTAVLANRPADQPAVSPALPRLEIALAFVPAVRIQPPFVTLPDLPTRGTAEAEFVAWSSTRPRFKLDAKADTQHPCVEVAVTPLTEAERERWAPTLKSRVQSGYLVRVKVHERRSDKEQLDLGPFRRKIELVSDAAAEPLHVELTGNVRGEVVLDASTDGRLTLGSFPARTGMKKQFILVSDHPGAELLDEVVVEPPEAGYLVVKLGKDKQASGGGRTQWNLSVQVPPGRTAGTLPRGTAVVLKIQGDPPRRLRLPVTGTGFN